MSSAGVSVFTDTPAEVKLSPVEVKLSPVLAQLMHRINALVLAMNWLTHACIL